MNSIVYLAFFIFYIICFSFSFKKNTELISLTILFIITGVFITYNINSFYNYNTSYLPNRNFYISTISLLAALFAVSVHFIGLLLIIVTNFYLKTKFEHQTGEPLYTSNTYKDMLNDFKTYFITTTLLCFILFVVFLYKEETVRQNSFGLEFTLCIYAMSLVVAVISYYQFIRANGYAKLRQKSYMAAPSNTNVISYDEYDYTDENAVPTEKPKVRISTAKPTETKPTETSVDKKPIEVKDTKIKAVQTPALATTRPPPPEFIPVQTPGATVDPMAANIVDFSNNRYLLAEPTLTYSEYCNLDTNDIMTLFNNSSLTYGNRAKFTQLKKGCKSTKTDKVDIFKNTATSAGTTSVANGANYKDYMKENYNPEKAQSKWMDENTPDLK